MVPPKPVHNGSSNVPAGVHANADCHSDLHDCLCGHDHSCGNTLNSSFLIDPHHSLYLQHLELVSPFQLYYNPTTVIKGYQFWRLVTTFLYFGQISFTFFFNLVFTYRYCRMLEEGSFRNRSADFVMMFLFGGTLMLVSVGLLIHNPVSPLKLLFILSSYSAPLFICCSWARPLP